MQQHCVGQHRVVRSAEVVHTGVEQLRLVTGRLEDLHERWGSVGAQDLGASVLEVARVLGCGPGHVTRWLAARHPSTVGIDLSPGMVALARERAPELTFQQGSMLDLAVDDGAWSAIVALYSVIHLTDEERATACREMARTLRPGGWLLLAFHVDSDEVSVGQVHRVTRWFGTDVELEAHFLEPEVVIGGVEAAGFRVMSRTEREPSPDVEYPSRRCYLLAQRRGPARK